MGGVTAGNGQRRTGSDRLLVVAATDYKV